MRRTAAVEGTATLGATALGSYDVEVDGADPDDWDEALSAFADANLYQTWAYGAVRWGHRRTSRLVVRRDGDVVAMAQLAVFQPPRIHVGLAQLRWGPVWHRRGEAPDAHTARAVADGLHAEYVVRRGLHLRILPGNANRPATVAALREALLRRCAPATFDHGESYRTVMLDLRPSLDTLRRGLDQKWRNQLNRAERNGLRVYRDCGSRALSAFAGIYRQMLERKRFVAPGLDSYARMQTALPQRQKLQVFVCEEAGHPVAGLVLATVGATGTYILGATNDLGMRCKGAYLLQWRAIEYMKEQGLEQYDLGGINVRANPGVAHFKRGLGGVEWDYLTPFVDCRNPASGLAADALRMIKHLRTRPGAPQAVASSH